MQVAHRALRVAWTRPAPAPSRPVRGIDRGSRSQQPGSCSRTRRSSADSDASEWGTVLRRGRPGRGSGDHSRLRYVTLRQTFAKVFPKVRHTFETKVEETFAKVRSCFRRKTKVASRKTKVASRVWFKSQIWSKIGRNSDFLRRSGAFEAEKHHPARA